MKLALQVALESRRETFLAHYPRSLKMAMATVLLIPMFALVLIMGKSKPAHLIVEPQEQQQDQYQNTSHERADREPQVSSEALLANRTARQEVPLTEAEKHAAQQNDDYANALMAPPNSALIEKRQNNSLPKISSQGDKPWEYYARPFNSLDPRPRIALVIVDLGLSRIATDSAVHRLPGPVTLVFDVQGMAIKEWLARARADGHETLLSLPMEPVDYPRNDSGPGSLLMSLSNQENMERLTKFLSAGIGYVGVTTMTGSRFLSDPQKIRPILQEVKQRGLMVFDAEISSYSALFELAQEYHVPATMNSLKIDQNLTPYDIEQALLRVEKIARAKGHVVAIASPLPLTLDQISSWIQTLKEKGFVLAPLSAVVKGKQLYGS
ncbi:MAG: divergent polysaccharide deacetylase family protein [Bdellovibrionales bacterium]